MPSSNRPTVSQSVELARASMQAKESIWLNLCAPDQLSDTAAEKAFGVKDNIYVAGLPVSAGTPVFGAMIAESDATVVARLRAAGALPIGKTQMHELGFGVTSNNRYGGAVLNPRYPDLTPGGSSGGSAASVAAGHVSFSLGTDTGGSTRLPAVFCGVYGFRPSHGRWPSDGVVPLSPSRDTIGVLAQDIETIRWVDQVATADHTRVAPWTPTDVLRIGLPAGLYLNDLDDQIKAMFDDTLSKLTGKPVELVSVDLPELAQLDESAGFTIALYEAGQFLRSYCESNQIGWSALTEQLANPDVRELFEVIEAGAIDLDTYKEARDVTLPAIRRQFDTMFEAHRIDVILAPASPVAAPVKSATSVVSINGEERPLFPTVSRNTSPASLSSHPSLAIPIVSPSGKARGAGILLEAPRGNDRKLLAIGQWFDALLTSAS